MNSLVRYVVSPFVLQFPSRMAEKIGVASLSAIRALVIWSSAREGSVCIRDRAAPASSRVGVIASNWLRI
jgi:hypothetical protein